jgi:hydrogenase maturation protease
MNYIIAIGNIMRSDDGIGVHIVEYIQKHNLEKNFQALDFATNVWGILSVLNTDTEKILIIDCAHLQQKPGTAQFFSLDDVIEQDNVIEQDKVTTESHESSFTQLLMLAKQADYYMPTIFIMGIEPKAVKFDPSLSCSLEDKLAEYAHQAIHFIQSG